MPVVARVHVRIDERLWNRWRKGRETSRTWGDVSHANHSTYTTARDRFSSRSSAPKSFFFYFVICFLKNGYFWWGSIDWHMRYSIVWWKRRIINTIIHDEVLSFRLPLSCLTHAKWRWKSRALQRTGIFRDRPHVRNARRCSKTIEC